MQRPRVASLGSYINMKHNKCSVELPFIQNHPGKVRNSNGFIPAILNKTGFYEDQQRTVTFLSCGGRCCKHHPRGHSYGVAAHGERKCACCLSGTEFPRYSNDGQRCSETGAQIGSQGIGRGHRGSRGERWPPDNAPRLSADGEEEEAVSGDARSAGLRSRSRQRVS